MIKIKPIFAWYGIWVGAFIDKSKKCVYLFPFPCFGVMLEWGIRNKEHYDAIYDYVQRASIEDQYCTCAHCECACGLTSDEIYGQKQACDKCVSGDHHQSEFCNTRV